MSPDEPFSLDGTGAEDAPKKALATSPPNKFALGDRVRVSQGYDLEYLRGALGTITIGTPDRRSDGIYAVEFDGSTVSYGEDYSVEGIEFEVRFLELVK
jgi:hypothetical protein